MERTSKIKPMSKQIEIKGKKLTARKLNQKPIKKIPITLASAKVIEVIKSHEDNDDYTDIKELLYMISPRELEKPHHSKTNQEYFEQSNTINYLNEEAKSADFQSLSPGLSSTRSTKDFIIRKNVFLRHKKRQN